MDGAGASVARQDAAKGTTRRGMLRLAGLGALLMFLPRCGSAAITSPITALSKTLSRMWGTGRLKMEYVADRLRRWYGFEAEPSPIEVTTPDMTLALPDGSAYLVGTGKVYEDASALPPTGTIDGLLFQGGLHYGDAAGDGAVDTLDFAYLMSVEDVQRKYGSVPLSDASGEDIAPPADAGTEALRDQMHAALPTLPDAPLYPIDQITELFHRARARAARGKGSLSRAEVESYRPLLLADLQEEQALRDRLEALVFYDEQEDVIREAAYEQTRILRSIQALREGRAQHLLRKLAAFVGGA